MVYLILMRFFGKLIFWFLVALTATGFLLASVGYAVNKYSFFQDLVSPLPSFITNTGNVSPNFWQPNLEPPTIKKPLDLSAHAAISYDMESNKLLYEKNIDQRLPIASLTKIMTAIVAIENLNLDKEVAVSRSAATIGEGTMGLSENEVLPIRELLYGLLLQSGNDAAETIAQTSKFGREGFLHLMNKKAEELGLSNMRLTNPTGLEGDGDQYGTAKELVVLTRYALNNPVFAEIVATYEHSIPKNPSHKAFKLFNETNLLTTYPGVKGVKTGFTDEAGLCLITYLDYGGHKIIGVILNSQNRRAEMASLLDYSLKELGVEPPKH